ncbi:hypothetical protein TTHERM_00942730 (macronuclear) [Tetrahymena thermophila SB210]|uniref:Uncharacterized protein n=1 Tax=Tetrahymena thermophila (strain SB210) TaxID=312017 RepID=Q22DK6_TETTS|nr:hypothetical protein TTHERM_00942730 [Tetrahymena thermophila SB210]EAR83352.2 hypothetical protein TTHERM_00942730 [Tetrahymena thermophila SB210]|eukprot:XP_001031015.2 hypothetical protein TTHERM_00942730 [Tetrahymena thermophila SB210]
MIQLFLQLKELLKYCRTQMGNNTQRPLPEQKVKAKRLLNTTIIWGDYNNNQDNKYLINQLVEFYNFKEENIFQCFNESDFYLKLQKYGSKNTLIMMSGRFATQKNFQNVKYVDQLITNCQINCRYILIYTSEQTINQQNLSLATLQSQYPSLMALEHKYKQLVQQMLNLIYNYSHIPFELQENQQNYLSSEQDTKLINIFTKSEYFDLNKQYKKLNIEDEKLKRLIDLLKNVNSDSPLDKFKDESLVKNFLHKIKQCCKQNTITQKSQIIQKQNIVNNLIHLFSKEGDIYKLVNFTLCTLNPLIYDCMKPVYKLFSAALTKYDDENNFRQLKLYRGSVISKSFYQQISYQFVLKESKNEKTFIFFPSFISTTLDKQVAQYLVAPQQIQTQILSSSESLVTPKLIQNQTKIASSSQDQVASQQIQNQTQIVSSSQDQEAPQQIQTQTQTESGFENMEYEVYEIIYNSRKFLLDNTILYQYQQGQQTSKISKEVYQLIKKFRPFLLQNQNSVQNTQTNQNINQQFVNQENEEEELKDESQVEPRNEDQIGFQNNQEGQEKEESKSQNEIKQSIYEEFKNHDEEDFRLLPKDMSNFYKVIFHIKANISLENPYRPKYISKISEYSEEEFLFQPFSKFKVLRITEPDNLRNDDQAIQFHEIYLEYQE